MRTSPRGPDLGCRIFSALCLVFGASQHVLAQPVVVDGDARCDNPYKMGPEVRVTDDPAGSYDPSLVWTGSEYGVSWEDHRDGFGQSQIYFARVDAAGNKIGLDHRITDYPFSSSNHPSLVWAGSEYGVAWWDDRVAPYQIYQIYFARIDAAGNKFGSDLRVTNHLEYAEYPSLVWTGSEYGVSWSDGRTSSGIYFARIDVAGNVIGSDLPVTDEPAPSRFPSLAWTGSGFGVSWHDYRDGNYEIYFARTDAAGNKIGSDIRVTSNPAASNDPSLVWTGSEYGVAWQDYRDGSAQIYFARIDAAGNKIGSDVRIADHPWSSRDPSLVWTGSEYGVAWERGYQVYFARIDAMGNEIGSDLQITTHPADSENPSLVWTGSEYGVAWRDERDGNFEIYFARIGCDCIDYDSDLDGVLACEDCDDSDSLVYPGALQACDGVNNDCGHPSWPALDGTNEFDHDLDGLTECDGDCDDAIGTVYPGASQICDGLNNDCLDPDWPDVPPDEVDDDRDFYAECQGDCNDADGKINPRSVEVCNAVDDDCDTLIDEDALGEDTDGDGVHNLCDNCRETPGADQSDSDQDGVGDLCDNCFFTRNPTQSDVNDDLEGDHCDLDDGVIYILFHQPGFVEWQEEAGFDRWNSYRGDLRRLHIAQAYTQDPSLIELAERTCGTTDPWVADIDPPAGKGVFFLTTGLYTGTTTESSLGVDSTGVERLNGVPCP